MQKGTYYLVSKDKMAKSRRDPGCCCFSARFVLSVCLIFNIISSTAIAAATLLLNFNREWWEKETHEVLPAVLDESYSIILWTCGGVAAGSLLILLAVACNNGPLLMIIFGVSLLPYVFAFIVEGWFIYQFMDNINKEYEHQIPGGMEGQLYLLAARTLFIGLLAIVYLPFMLLLCRVWIGSRDHKRSKEALLDSDVVTELIDEP